MKPVQSTEAALAEQLEEVEQLRERTRAETVEKWIKRYSYTGMTCAGCGSGAAMCIEVATHNTYGGECDLHLCRKCMAALAMAIFTRL